MTTAGHASAREQSEARDVVNRNYFQTVFTAERGARKSVKQLKLHKSEKKVQL
jgi:hypothetical protein